MPGCTKRVLVDQGLPYEPGSDFVLSITRKGL